MVKYMANKLCKITLSVKDYETRKSGSFIYEGEVIELDAELKRFMYRFYETDLGTLNVSIDFSKDKVIIVESSDNVLLTLALKKDEYCKCNYRLDENHSIFLENKAFTIDISDSKVYLDYDLFDSKDKNHDKPISRNIVEIEVRR